MDCTVSKSGKIHKSQTPYQHNLGPEKKNVCSLSVIIAYFWALKVIAKFGVSHCSKCLICNKSVDLQQNHCNGCRYGGGVDRRHAAVARCLADVIQSHSGAEVFIEQEVLALTRVVNGQSEHARMDLLFNFCGSVTYLDVSIVAPFSCNPSLVSAASTRPGLMAKRAEKNKFDRYPHINLVPFIKPQVDQVHTPEKSSATPCETLTTLH